MGSTTHSETRFDTLNFKLDIPLSRKKKKKVIRFINEGQIRWQKNEKFVGMISDFYLTDKSNEKKKTSNAQNSV